MNLHNKISIVTGAGSKRGIGRAIAIKLAEYGSDIVIADMDIEGAQAVAAEIESGGRRALAVQTNVTNEESVKKMISSVVAAFGKVDILVNNAGITQPVTTVNTTLDDWNRIVSVNLTGTFLCSREAVKVMKTQNYGRIISISSVSGKRGGGVYGGSHYSAAKAGILGFSKALAREVVENNITVNCVSPGLVATDIRKGLSDEREKSIWEAIPMKRPGTPEEIAETVAFLASDGASYITGEDIDVNGGSYMD